MNNRNERPGFTDKAVKGGYKDRMFRLIFREKAELLGLYNAVNQTNYKNPEDLIVNTLEQAIYMGMRNDVSFIIDARMSLYEHQSTNNPNMPLRALFYVSDLYSGMIRESHIYGKTLVRISTPKFVVFYNGVEKAPERQILRLSDAYEIQDEDKELELKVLVLNINEGYNSELKETCRTLRDYMYYVDVVRGYAQQMPIEQAVDKAIDECIKDDVLAEFLRKNRAEAMKVSIYEYDEEEHMNLVRQEGRKEGIQEGRKEGIREGIQEGIQDGKITTVDLMMQKLQISLEEACRIAEITQEEYVLVKNREKQR